MNLSSSYRDQVLDGRDFSHRCLIGITFVKCSLRRCDFRSSDLSYCHFEDCDLYESDFREAVLYTTRILHCDATKVRFENALMNGIRIQDTDITHAALGRQLRVGANRKRLTHSSPGGGFLICELGEPISPPSDVERTYTGVCCLTTGIAIDFVAKTPDHEWRSFRRQSEIAKTLERVLHENGYKDRSLEMYYQMRYYRSRATPSRLAVIIRVVFLELIWGYGVRPLRPALSLFGVAMCFAMLYSSLPYLDPSSGIGSSIPVRVVSEGTLCGACVRDVAVFALQVASLSVYGETNPIGLGKWVAVIQTVISVAMVGLLVATLTRRIGNV